VDSDSEDDGDCVCGSCSDVQDIPRLCCKMSPCMNTHAEGNCNDICRFFCDGLVFPVP
jgi:hypothetical protein